MSANEFEAQGRETKARTLARGLLADTIRVVRSIQPEEWEQLADRYGTKAPSAETAKRVVELLEEIAI